VTTTTTAIYVRRSAAEELVYDNDQLMFEFEQIC